MTIRILRIELRRSAAPGTAALIVVLGAAMLWLTTDRQGWWMRMAMHQRSMLGLLWPLALGAGAWQARRERRSGMEELISTTPRPRWRRVLPTTAAMAIAAVVGYLGMFASGAGFVVPVATYVPAHLVPIVVIGALFLISAVCLGLAIGSRLPSALTPPILVVACAAVLVVSFRNITHGGDPPGTFLYLPVLQVTNYFVPEFVTVTTRVHVAQVLWLIAVAATGLVAFAAASRRGRALAVVPAVLGAAIVLPLQPSRLSGAFVFDQAAVAMVCTPDTPRVCVTTAHEAALADLRAPAREALTILSAKLPNAPTSVVEEYRLPGQTSPPADTVPVWLDVNNIGRVRSSPEQLLWGLLAGAGTAFCYDLVVGGETDRYVSARLVAAAWLIDAPPSVALYQGPRSRFFDAQLAGQALAALRSMPVAEQQARVAALREAELACDRRDRLDLLTGPSGPR